MASPDHELLQGMADLSVRDTQGELTLPVFDNLKSLLIDSRDRPDVVFFGEGNFTFTLAFATLRHSAFPRWDFWQGIISTRYEPLPESDEHQLESIQRYLSEEHRSAGWAYLEALERYFSEEHHSARRAYIKALEPDYPAPDFANVKLQTVRACVHNGGKLRDRSTVTKALSVVNAPLPPPGIALYGVDATNIPAGLPVRRKAVWFQCPWVYQAPREKQPKTCNLMKDFLRHIASKQATGDYALIGIVEHGRYVKNYHINDKLLSDVMWAGHYKLLGVDRELVKEVLKYGYHHQTGPGHGDIHDDILKFHATLVFQRQCTVDGTIGYH